jgi:PPP family 3-phenylpropionic acid transporter
VPLASFYFWYFSTLAIIIAFFNLYAKQLGLSSFEISVLASLHPLSRVLWPPFWSGLADRSGRRHLVTAAASLGATIAFGAFFRAGSFRSLLFAQAVFTFFWSTTLPLTETSTLEQASIGKTDYGRTRVWGSIGFILAGFGLGPLLDRLGVRFTLWAILGCLVFTTIATFFAPAPLGRHAREEGSVLTFLRRPQVRLFVLVGMLSQLSHATMYNFLSIHLAEVGYSNKAIGVLWAFGVCCEVPVIRFSALILGRFRRMRLLTFSLFVAALRWSIFSLTTAYPLLLLAQAMHAVTFAVFHVAAVTHTYAVVPPSLRARGQSLYSALSFGLGNFAGFLINGAVYDRVGASACFAGSAAVALLAALLSLGLREPQPLP